jgi:hypothetical protein
MTSLLGEPITPENTATAVKLLDMTSSRGLKIAKAEDVKKLSEQVEVSAELVKHVLNDKEMKTFEGLESTAVKA